jgi:aldehyde dehydrogenase (NAD+)
VRDGARLVTGGTGRPDGLDRGWYVRPTQFADVDNRTAVAQEEIFGAIALANDSIDGLAGAVWTADPERGLAVAEQVQAGTFGVNQGDSMDPAAPFGGVKASGDGRELGREGIDACLRTKSIPVARA